MPTDKKNGPQSQVEIGNFLDPLICHKRRQSSMSVEPLVAITTIKYTANINTKACLMKFLTWLFAFQDI